VNGSTHIQITCSKDFNFLSYTPQRVVSQRSTAHAKIFAEYETTFRTHAMLNNDVKSEE